MRRARALYAAAVLAAWPAQAFAGDFDDRGLYRPAPDAVFVESFVAPERHVLDDDPIVCFPEGYTLVEDELALEGDTFIRVRVKQDCSERFVVQIPEGRGSYAASLWIRHGSAGARLVVKYPDETGIPLLTARLSATGRATSDGWIELASNELPIDTALDPLVYLRFTDFASAEGVDLDALEIVPMGSYRDIPECDGVSDPICGEDAVCVGGRCRLGNPTVPPLPLPEIRDAVVDSMANKLRVFFGGKKTRTLDMPVALATLESIRGAKSAWAFWNGWARSVRELHDWHTSARGPIGEGSIRGRLNACFIEGDADLSHHVLPRHPVYADLLVSHTGTEGTAGLHRGDRLVAVDGEHPIAWARKLIEVNWGWHVACDDSSFQDFAENLGGYGLILQYAKSISVIRCDRVAGACSDVVETLQVKDLPSGGGGVDVACDNRPLYHLGDASPGDDHYVFYSFFKGRIEGTTEEEAIYGMVWDTLYGGGAPNGYVNGNIRNAIADWKANARGVILDHRAGNGGTIDAPEYLTQLVRPEEPFAILPTTILTAGYEGPATIPEGIQLFNYLKNIDQPYTIGADDHDPELPVALIVHRDGSASDYLPLGFKGAPKAKIFGPAPTAGAFSTFIQFAYWGGINFQLASGDTLTKDGEVKIGHGVVPDVLVEQRQSDLVQGIDTIHEAALAWVRSELKP